MDVFIFSLLAATVLCSHLNLSGGTIWRVSHIGLNLFTQIPKIELHKIRNYVNFLQRGFSFKESVLKKLIIKDSLDGNVLVPVPIN